MSVRAGAPRTRASGRTSRPAVGPSGAGPAARAAHAARGHLAACPRCTTRRDVSPRSSRSARRNLATGPHFTARRDVAARSDRPASRGATSGAGRTARTAALTAARATLSTARAARLVAARSARSPGGSRTRDTHDPERREQDARQHTFGHERLLSRGLARPTRPEHNGAVSLDCPSPATVVRDSLAIVMTAARAAKREPRPSIGR